MRNSTKEQWIHGSVGKVQRFGTVADDHHVEMLRHAGNRLSSLRTTRTCRPTVSVQLLRWPYSAIIVVCNFHTCMENSELKDRTCHLNNNEHLVTMEALDIENHLFEISNFEERIGTVEELSRLSLQSLLRKKEKFICDEQ